MANGTTQILPSPTGGGLERGVRGFFDERARRRQLDQQERQLDLEERRTAIQERGAELEELLTLIPFMPAGITVSEAPEVIKDRFHNLYPEFDPNDPEDFGALMFNDDPESVINRLLINEVEDLAVQAEDTGEGVFSEGQLERWMNLATLGEARSDAELEAQKGVANIHINAMENLAENPQLLRDIGRRQFGLDQEVRFQDPTTDQDMLFTSEASGQIWASLKGQELRGLFDLKASQRDPAQELMDQYASLYENQRQLGRSAANRIVREWRQSTSGNFEPGESPIEQLYAQSAPDIRQAIQLFTGSVRAGDQKWQGVLEATPGGQQALFFNWVAGQNRENFGPEEGLTETRNFFRNFENAGFGVTVDRPLGVLRPRFNFELGTPEETIARDPEAPLPEGGEGEGAPPPEDSFTREQALLTIQEGVREGFLSEDEARSEFGDELVDEALSPASGSGAPPPGSQEAQTPSREERGLPGEEGRGSRSRAAPDTVSQLIQNPDNVTLWGSLTTDDLRNASLEQLEALEGVGTDILEEDMEIVNTSQNARNRINARRRSNKISEQLGLIGRLIHQAAIRERQGNVER